MESSAYESLEGLFKFGSDLLCSILPLNHDCLAPLATICIQVPFNSDERAFLPEEAIWKASCVLVSSVVGQPPSGRSGTALSDATQRLEWIAAGLHEEDPSLLVDSTERFFRQFLEVCAPRPASPRLPLHDIIKIIHAMKWVAAVFQASPKREVSVIVPDSLLSLLESPSASSSTVSDLALIIADLQPASNNVSSTDNLPHSDQPGARKVVVVLADAEDASNVLSDSEMDALFARRTEPISKGVATEALFDFLTRNHQGSAGINHMVLYLLKPLVCPEAPLLFVKKGVVNIMATWMHEGNVYERTKVADYLLCIALRGVDPLFISTVVGCHHALQGLVCMVTGHRAGKRCAITIIAGVECLSYFLLVANDQDFLRITSTPDFGYAFEHAFTGSFNMGTVRGYAALDRYLGFSRELGRIQSTPLSHPSHLSTSSPDLFLERLYEISAGFAHDDGTPRTPMHTQMIRAFDDMMVRDSLCYP